MNNESTMKTIGLDLRHTHVAVCTSLLVRLILNILTWNKCQSEEN